MAGSYPDYTGITGRSVVGTKNINASINALLIGFSLVLAFMMIYYGGGGIMSVIALFLNIFFIFGALASFGTVLTLPGIAGIVLTIGMAVDANVVIFERIKEELREGKALKVAINDGFNNSYSAIIDANITTFLVAMILNYFGLGPIKGFAVVLMIGVVSSVFTAVLVGRTLIEWWTDKNRNVSFWTSATKNAFANLNIDWMGKRKLAYVVSGTLLVVSIAAIVIRGFEFGVDFKGGYSYNVEFERGTSVTTESFRNALSNTLQGSSLVVKAVDTENTFNLVTDYLVNSTDSTAADQVMEKIFESANAVAGGNLVLEAFRDANGTGTHVTSSSKVGPTIADDIQKSAIWASIFSLLVIFLYILIRFGRGVGKAQIAYPIGAVGALFHDVTIVLGAFALLHGFLPFSLEIDQAFIAAILTVIGYSINDTVIVFDRVREYLNQYTSRSKNEVLNLAINSTFSRTINTSLTTLVVIVILFVFGGASIKGFAFALLIGIFVGTYSSIFIATPIMSEVMGDMRPQVVAKTDNKKAFSKLTQKVKIRSRYLNFAFLPSDLRAIGMN
ncbi:MAG: protein translocase subunit SecF [Saprospiraceae bacterium]|nr:protein translocase subunit SecF [Saprospiraceae bacterium]